MTQQVDHKLSRDHIFTVLQAQLKKLADSYETIPDEIHWSDSIMTDLGFDSITVVELCCAVEEALQIKELPLNQWLNEESDKDGERYTIASFVDLILSANASR
jgi:acyl carrier protein